MTRFFIGNINKQTEKILNVISLVKICKYSKYISKIQLLKKKCKKSIFKHTLVLLLGKATCLTSFLGCKFINIWGQVLSCESSQDRLKVCIGETTPVWCFLYLHQSERFAHTDKCCQTYRAFEQLVFRDETWELCRVALCLECVSTLVFYQLHINCKRITEQFKFIFPSSKVSVLIMLSLLAKCALENKAGVSLAHWSLPQLELSFKSSDYITHVRDHMVLPLKLEVKWIEMLCYIAQKCQLTQPSKSVRYNWPVITDIRYYFAGYNCTSYPWIWHVCLSTCASDHFNRAGFTCNLHTKEGPASSYLIAAIF